MTRANRSKHGLNDFYGGGKNQSVQVVIPLGTGAVTTQTKTVGSVPRDCIVTGIRFYGQSAPTATTLTAEVFARTTAGAAGNTQQSAATDIDFASGVLALAGVEASLTATEANLRLVENQLFEVVVTAASATVGPGDLLVEIEFVPRFRAE